MSDLQDLIHTNAHNAYEIGVRTERERIMTILENNKVLCSETSKCDWAYEAGNLCECDGILPLIKGDQK